MPDAALNVLAVAHFGRVENEVARTRAKLAISRVLARFSDDLMHPVMLRAPQVEPDQDGELEQPE